MITILLLPGMDGTGKMFQPLMEKLPNDWDIRVVDYPADEALGYDKLVVEASRSVPDNGNYFLLGESFSGPIAVSLAENADSRLKGVIFCCTFTRNPLGILKYVGGFLSKFPISLTPSFVIEKVLFGKYRSPYLSQLLKESLSDVSNKVLSQRLLEIRDIDVSSKLSKLKVPLTYLRATQDLIVKNKESTAMAKAAQHMSIVDIKGPHCLLQASPGIACDVICEFARKHGGQNGSNN